MMKVKVEYVDNEEEWNSFWRMAMRPMLELQDFLVSDECFIASVDSSKKPKKPKVKKLIKPGPWTWPIKK